MTTESETAEGWTIAGEWSYLDSQVVLGRVTMTPPGNRATIADLKAVWRQIRLAWVAAEWEHVFRSREFALPDEWVRGFADSPRPGRAGNSPKFYARWVQRYLEAVDTGASRPVAQLASAHPGESNESINRYIRKAERLGLIKGRPGRGVAGGVMTDRCRELLDQAV